MNLVLLGAPGAGKGTVAQELVAEFGVAHISTGDLLRAAVKGGTELGIQAKKYMDAGELVPDQLVIDLVKERLAADDAQQGFILDGFPRNMVQAKKLWDALQQAGMKLDYVVEILLPREVAKNRIMGRRLCKNDNNHPNNIFIDAIKPNGDKCRVCGGELTVRSDDQDEAAINKRHDIYYDKVNGTLAAAYFYKELAKEGKTKYIELNGEGTIDEIKDTLLKQLA
jgi:adenylate kinase